MVYGIRLEVSGHICLCITVVRSDRNLLQKRDFISLCSADSSRMYAYPVPWGEKMVCTHECNSSGETTYSAVCGGVVDSLAPQRSLSSLNFRSIVEGLIFTNFWFMSCMM